MNSVRQKLPQATSRCQALKAQHGRVALPESARASLELLLRIPEIERLILFGSRAVGDNDDRSDFDVAISAPTLERGALSGIRDMIDQSRTLYHISVSVLEFMPPALQARVLRQGITLYER